MPKKLKKKTTPMKQAIGARLKEIREEQGLSQAAIGRRVGKSGSYVGRIEKGGESPIIDTFLDILAALETTTGDFFLPWLSTVTHEDEIIKAVRLALRHKAKSQVISSLLDVAKADVFVLGSDSKRRTDT